MTTVSPSVWRRPLTLLLTLTFSTGVVDAVGYLGLDHVFAGNMTGNVVILGMGMAGGTGLPVAGPLIGLLAFMAGAAVGGRALRGTTSGWTARARAVFGAVAVTVAAAGVAALATGAHRGVEAGAGGFVVTGLLALGMGMQAAAARHVRVMDVTTVVVTSTITALASDSWWGLRTQQPWSRRAAAVVVVLLGALVGALVLRVGIVEAIAISAFLTAGVVAVGRPAPVPNGVSAPVGRAV